MLYLLFKRLAACIHHLSDSCSQPFLLLVGKINSFHANDCPIEDRHVQNLNQQIIVFNRFADFDSIL